RRVAPLYFSPASAHPTRDAALADVTSSCPSPFPSLGSTGLPHAWHSCGVRGGVDERMCGSIAGKREGCRSPGGGEPVAGRCPLLLRGARPAPHESRFRAGRG